jgi:hypothetical protein
MVLANGYAYATSLIDGGEYAGYLLSDGYLLMSGSSYMGVNCNSRILISKPVFGPGACTKKKDGETEATHCNDLLDKYDPTSFPFPYSVLAQKCCLCGRVATAAATCTFCEAGKFNKDSRVSSCASCASFVGQPCKTSKDCEYDVSSVSPFTICAVLVS